LARGKETKPIIVYLCKPRFGIEARNRKEGLDPKGF